MVHVVFEIPPESLLLVVIGREVLTKDRGINGASEMVGSLLGTHERLKESPPRMRDADPDPILRRGD